MKKLMVAFAAVAMAAAANAGAYAWGFSSGMDEGSSDPMLMEATGMLFLGTVGQKDNGDGTYSLDFASATFIAANGFVDPDNFDYTIGSPAFNAGVTDARISDTLSQKYSLVLFEKDGVTDYAKYEGKYFLATGDSAISADPETGTAFAQMVYANAVTQGDWKTAAAPEPTSGLLLLLGVAGLALKRRRA